MEATLQVQSTELRTSRKNESDPKRKFNKAGNRDWRGLGNPPSLCAFSGTQYPYKLGLTPFEIVYGSPLLICPVFKGKTKPSLSLCMFQQEMLALSKVYKHIWSLIREVYEGQSKGTIPSHDMGPGDWVWVKRQQSKTLEPRWKGPYVVLLTTPTALKVDRIGPWVHCNHVRRATPEEQERPQKNGR